MAHLKPLIIAAAIAAAAASPAAAATRAPALASARLELPIGPMIDGLEALAVKGRSAVAGTATRIDAPAAAPLFAAGLAIVGWRMGRRRRR